MICGVGQIIVGEGVIGRKYLRLFLLVVERGTTVLGYGWCQICTKPTQNDDIMSVFTVI